MSMTVTVHNFLSPMWYYFVALIFCLCSGTLDVVKCRLYGTSESNRKQDNGIAERAMQDAETNFRNVFVRIAWLCLGQRMTHIPYLY